MRDVLHRFERGIVLLLLSMMMVAILVSTVELAIILVRELLKPPMLLLNVEEMLEVFGFFLMILIGLELLETITAYLKDDTIHAEVVFLVAIVAVARKAIILDYKSTTPEMLYGMAALILALSGGYFLVRRGLARVQKPSAPAE